MNILTFLKNMDFGISLSVMFRNPEMTVTDFGSRSKITREGRSAILEGRRRQHYDLRFTH